ncbi:hypothetical protein C8039_19315 [Halogeometricum sp. wsp3]|nr:hypothetical protein C8039_19315 [Halogeometricum sp. wsp3]
MVFQTASKFASNRSTRRRSATTTVSVMVKRAIPRRRPTRRSESARRWSRSVGWNHDPDGTSHWRK